MKRRLLIIMAVLLTGGAGSLRAQATVPDTLLFVFKLHGQTCRYQMAFRERQDTLVLHWGIERNLHWQSGSYAMPPRAVEKAIRLSFLQPEDGQHVCLSEEEMAYILSRSAYCRLKSEGSFVYNRTTYVLQELDGQVLGHPLLHVRDVTEGGEMWIWDYAALPLIWKMQHNPLEIDWEVQTYPDRR